MNAPTIKPERSHYKPAAERTVQDWIALPEMRQRIMQIAPAHLAPDRMLRLLALAIQKTPKLAECNPLSLIGAFMVCVSLGLEPNTPLGHAYLIPFEKRKKVGKDKFGKDIWETERVDVNLIIGYKGYIDLARRSGSLVSIHADVVYEGDQFTFEYGTNTHLRHVPMGLSDVPIWAYAHASLKDGQAFEVLPYNRVLKIRDNSEGYKAAVRAAARNNKKPDTPWTTYEHEMAAKTMIRRVSKFLPLSTEDRLFARAVAIDGASEGGRIDFAKFVENGDAFDNEELAMAMDDAQVIENQPEQPIDFPQEREKEPAPAARDVQYANTMKAQPLGESVRAAAVTNADTDPLKIRTEQPDEDAEREADRMMRQQMGGSDIPSFDEETDPETGEVLGDAAEPEDPRSPARRSAYAVGWDDKIKGRQENPGQYRYVDEKTAYSQGFKEAPDQQ